VELNRDGVRVGIERQLDSDESDMEEDHTRLNHCLRVQYKNHDYLMEKFTAENEQLLHSNKSIE
jgi:hypothetical protein